MNRKRTLVDTVSSCRVRAMLLLILLATVPQAKGQQQATLSGIIADPSGAVIPDAAIRVTNNATQVTRTAMTNATGYYLVLNLTPGTYSIVAQKEGFKTATQTGITLQVAQSATVDLRLELGQTSQEVTVSGAAPLLQTSESTIGQVIGPTTMVEMPLNPGAFTVAPPLQFGNAGKGIIQGPHSIDLDAAAMRDFKLMESLNLEFRAEAFNLANHANFADPNPVIDIPSVAGSITSTTTTSRQLQLALKLNF